MKVTVDDVLRSRLHDFRWPLELCDESGRVLGYLRLAGEQSMYEGVKSPTSDDELRRRSQAGGGRTLSEILQELETRG